jgi:DNA-binding MarR family transcriptional regulator
MACLKAESSSRKKVRVSKEPRAQLIAEVAHEVAEFQHAVDVVDEAAATRLGVNRTDLRVLGALFRLGRMPVGQLARLAGLSPGAMTVAIDRLERSGYARRLRATDDRRSVLVEITPKGRSRSEQIYGPIGQEGMASLERYDDAELGLLRDFLRAARELQERHATRIAARGPASDKRGPRRVAPATSS